MKTPEQILQEIKDQVAYENDWIDWGCFKADCDITDIEIITDIVAKRFAIEVAKQTLENIASNSQEMIYSRKMITRDILNEPIVLNQHCHAVPKHEILKETTLPELLHKETHN